MWRDLSLRFRSLLARRSEFVRHTVRDNICAVTAMTSSGIDLGIARVSTEFARPLRGRFPSVDRRSGDVCR